MRLNFKTILIIFLVAILGSGIGTFGILSLYSQNAKSIANDTNLVVHQVEYTNIVKSDYTTAIEKAYDSVVEITASVQTNSYFYFGGTSKSVSKGSGVIISEDGYIVTNEHVISGVVDEDAIVVKLSSNEEMVAKLIGYDTKTDLALLKIDANNLSYATLVDSSTLLLGQDAIAIGNPLGNGISCSNGIVSALEKEIYINNVYLTVIQTNAAVNAGNSGGGLFDINGNLIGIVNAKTSSSSMNVVEGMAYAIPSNTVIRIIQDIKENGYVKERAAFGIKVATNSYYNVNGVLVSEVIEGSSAEKVGIKANDTITSINDVPVTSYADLAKILETKSIGDVVKVSIIRDSQELTIDVTLQESTR